MSEVRPGDVRSRVWSALMEAQVALFPYPPFGHHPNFKGADAAASLLLEHLLKNTVAPGQTALCYPDYVLKPVRKGLLSAGVNVIVPDKYGKGYRYLVAGQVKASKGSSISGAQKEGVALDTLPDIDILFSACVALDANGRTLSKGYGFPITKGQVKAPVKEDTVAKDTVDKGVDKLVSKATVVHPLQITQLSKHDGKVDVYATPDAVVTLL